MPIGQDINLGCGPSTRLHTAEREMREENGITECSFHWGSASMETIPYSNGKVATYFLAKVKKHDITLPVSEELGRPEHDEYRWASPDEAKLLLPPRLVPILEWALNTVANN